MNKLIRLSPTEIDYGDYAWNFASGCGNNTEGRCGAGGFRCWAYPITKRFAVRYPNGFNPTIYPEALLSPLYLKKPSRILCAFMGDLFWDCPEFNPERKIEALMPSQKASVQMSLKGWIFTTIKQCPQHTFLFLTKQPQNLAKFSPFPDNCWVGVSATDDKAHHKAIDVLSEIEAKVKYISYEPLLGKIEVNPEWMNAADWVIIGGQTKPTINPKIENIKGIVEACDGYGIPVFLKDNLKLALPFESAEWAWARDDYYAGRSSQILYIGQLRQEMPV